MAAEHTSRLRCGLAFSGQPGIQSFLNSVRRAIEKAGYIVVPLDSQNGAMKDTVVAKLAKCDCIVADLSCRNSGIYFELGIAQAMGKAAFLLVEQAAKEVPIDLRGAQVITYEPTDAGRQSATNFLIHALEQYRQSPRQGRYFPVARTVTPFSVDWDRLDRIDAENLCQELLVQMGFQKLDWFKESPEIDLVAELPKKDPDGFSYRELWLVNMGRNAPPERLLTIATREPDYLVHRLLRRSEHFERLVSRTTGDVPITFLFVLLQEWPEQKMLFEEERHMKFRRQTYPLTIRVRIWDRAYLTSLVQQFPQIGYKYFSDEGRAKAKFRKTPEELYQENIDLYNRQTQLVLALEDEKNKRVRAERDAVWKDISFSAAHKIGNPIFAIETNLDPLHKRVAEQRTTEAIEVIRDIRSSIEKAKGIIDQFKSLTRAQEIKPTKTLLCPILDDACRVAQNSHFKCDLKCPPEFALFADPERLGECFDELIHNSTHWADKPDRKIEIVVTPIALPPLPPTLDTTKTYASIHVRDNGAGVPIENKLKIFDAFFTTHEHGTGLGLALVRRIIEGHGGAIFETGVPGQGADFEIYLPVSPLEEQTEASGKTR